MGLPVGWGDGRVLVTRHGRPDLSKGGQSRLKTGSNRAMSVGLASTVAPLRHAISCRSNVLPSGSEKFAPLTPPPKSWISPISAEAGATGSVCIVERGSCADLKVKGSLLGPLNCAVGNFRTSPIRELAPARRQTAEWGKVAMPASRPWLAGATVPWSAGGPSAEMSGRLSASSEPHTAQSVAVHDNLALWLRTAGKYEPHGCRMPRAVRARADHLLAQTGRGTGSDGTRPQRCLWTCAGHGHSDGRTLGEGQIAHWLS